VLAYCEVVAGRAAAATAAAEAFGSFRAGVVATPDLATLNPEALLISATRHAAARHATSSVPGGCGRVPALLAARADRSITLADHDWLDEHLASCWTCRAPVARFEAADRAYREPPGDSLDPAIRATMVAAMTAAAPVRGSTEETLAVGAGVYAEPASANGNRAAHDEPAAAYDVPLDPQTSAYELPPEELDVAPAAPEERIARRRRPAKRSSILAGLGAAKRPKRTPRVGAGAAAASAAGAAAATPAKRRSRPRRDLRTGSAGAPRAGAGGASLPRPSRIAATGAAGHREHRTLRPAVVLPVALVIVAIIAALAIAGVFGGGEGESNGQSFTPSQSVPASVEEAPVVVVPGAESAAAVEKAKERARAAKRAAERKAKQGASTPADGDAATTAPPPPPAATNSAPAAAPAPQADDDGGSTSGKPKIEAGNGATGAEELPAAQDTSTVPDLAPPVEPAVPPAP